MTCQLGKRLHRLEREAGSSNISRLLWLDTGHVTMLPQGCLIEQVDDEPEDVFKARVAEMEERSRQEATDC